MAEQKLKLDGLRKQGMEVNEPPICDFCASPLPTWHYPAESFIVPGLPPGESTGGWLACDDCHALIEKDDREGLARRGLLNPSVAVVGGPDRALPSVRRIHRQFLDHRLGPPERWAP